MRVSTTLDASDWQAAAEAARRAEDDGFDTVQVPELRHDPFIPLAFAARATERVQLVTSVAIAFPRSPMVVANTAFDLHRHSRGRFVLGLGTQVKQHNERRFSVPWIAPAARMAEYVQALRAIWRAWEYGERLRFEGAHYRFTLMTPEFSPPRTGLGLPPVAVAAVGPLMLRTAARHADGIRLHGFATRRYLDATLAPMLEAELATAGRNRAAVEISGGGFVATGPDEDAVRAEAEKIRYRVAFYGSTPAYQGVFAAHGLEPLGSTLNAMVKRGEWDRIAAAVPDEVLDLFVARGPYPRIAEAIAARFGGLADSVAIEFPPDVPAGTRRGVVRDIQAIPAAFTGFAQG